MLPSLTTTSRSAILSAREKHTMELSQLQSMRRRLEQLRLQHLGELDTLHSGPAFRRQVYSPFGRPLALHVHSESDAEAEDSRALHVVTSRGFLTSYALPSFELKAFELLDAQLCDGTSDGLSAACFLGAPDAVFALFGDEQRTVLLTPSRAKCSYVEIVSALYETASPSAAAAAAVRVLCSYHAPTRRLFLTHGAYVCVFSCEGELKLELHVHMVLDVLSRGITNQRGHDLDDHGDITDPNSGIHDITALSVLDTGLTLCVGTKSGYLIRVDVPSLKTLILAVFRRYVVDTSGDGLVRRTDDSTEVNYLAFAYQGTDIQVAACCADGVTHITDAFGGNASLLADPQELGFEQVLHATRCAWFNAQGDTLYAFDERGTWRIWDVQGKCVQGLTHSSSFEDAYALEYVPALDSLVLFCPSQLALWSPEGDRTPTPSPPASPTPPPSP